MGIIKETNQVAHINQSKRTMKRVGLIEWIKRS